MTAHDDIDQILNLGISIIQKEVQCLNDKEELNKLDLDKLTEYLKVLVTVKRDWRISEKETQTDTKSLSNEELEKAILEEAQRIKDKHGKV